MSGKHVFITGATGSVGGGILAALAAEGGFAVDCLVRRPEASAAVERAGGRAVVGDMGDEATFARLSREREYDCIIHAAQASYREFPPAEIDARERVVVHHLEMLATAATRLMVFTSGVWMYGNAARGRPINEDTPWEPFELSRERVTLLRELMARRDHPWAQLCPPSMVYHDFAGPQSFVARLRAGGAIEVLDDDRVLWSVVERNDLGRAYVALLHHGRAGDNFVVAEDTPVSVPAFYEAYACAIGRGRVLRRPWAEFSAGRDTDWLEVARTSQPVDAARFKARTGWRARETFATTVPRLLAGNGPGMGEG